MEKTKHIHIGSSHPKGGTDKYGKYSLGNCHHEATTVPTRRGVHSSFQRRRTPKSTLRMRRTR